MLNRRFLYQIKAPMRVMVLVLLSTACISSCGMQGDLYLPEEKADKADK